MKNAIHDGLPSVCFGGVNTLYVPRAHIIELGIYFSKPMRRIHMGWRDPLAHGTLLVSAWVLWWDWALIKSLCSVFPDINQDKDYTAHDPQLLKHHSHFHADENLERIDECFTQ